MMKKRAWIISMLLIAGLAGLSSWAGVGSQLLEGAVLNTTTDIGYWTSLYGTAELAGSDYWEGNASVSVTVTDTSSGYYQSGETQPHELTVYYQTEDLSAADNGISQTLINAGLYYAHWSTALGYLYGGTGDSNYDDAQVAFRTYELGGTWTWVDETGWYGGSSSTSRTGDFNIKPGTDDIRVYLCAEEDTGTDNDATVDYVYLYVYERSDYKILTSGTKTYTISDSDGSYSTSSDLTVGGATSTTYGGMYVKDDSSCTIGNLTIDTYGTVFLESGSTLSVDRFYNVEGTFYWTGGTIDIDEYCYNSWTIGSGKELQFTSTGEMVDSYRATIAGGTFDKSSTSTDEGDDIAMSSGTLDINSGTLSGGLYSLTGGNVTLDGGTWDADSSLSSISDAARVYIRGGSLISSATLDESDISFLNGHIHLDGGTHSSTYTVETYYNTTGKNLYIDSGATLNAGATGLDTISDYNQVYVNGGTVNAEIVNGFDVTVSSGTLNVSGSFTEAHFAQVNGGTVNLNDGFSDTSETGSKELSTFTGGTIAINSGASWDATDQLTTIADAAQVVLNGGSLTATALDTADLTLNSGTLNVAGGTLTGGLGSLSGGTINFTEGTWDASDSMATIADAAQVMLDGGTLIATTLDATDLTMNSGTLKAISVNGNLTVNGTFAPGNSPADSTVDGDLALSAEDTLEMEIGGTTVGTEYDRLTVTGTATLGGTLNVVLINGFTPSAHCSFELFIWSGGVSGTFDTISLPELGAGLTWDTSALYTAGILRIKEDQTISSFTPADGSSFTTCDSVDLSATASSGLTVTFSSEGDDIVAWTDSDTVTFTAIGSVQMIASQAGDDSYNAAEPVTNSWTITAGTPTISVWPTASSITYGDSLSASTLSGGTASVDGSFAFVSPSTAPDAGTASQSVRFTPTDAVNYTTVDGSVSVTVEKASQTIVDFAPANGSSFVSSDSVTLSATSTAGLPVTFSVSSGPGSIDGTTLSFSGAGTVVVDADQAGDDGYNAAPTVTRSYAVTSLEVPTATDATSVTETGFTANWDPVANAAGYRLDVATDAGFAYLVSGYNNLDVGNVTNSVLSGLDSNCTYYYRVRSYDASGNISDRSNVISVYLGSIDYRLSSLTVGSGSLTPAFDPDTQEYHVLLEDAPASFTFTPTAADGSAYIFIENALHASGTAYVDSYPDSLTSHYVIDLRDSSDPGTSVTRKTYHLYVTIQQTAIPAPAGTWVDSLIGDNYDPNDDQQATAATDLVGDGTNAMLQAQQNVINVNGGAEKVYYYRARLGNALTPKTSCYFGLDLDMDQCVDMMVEANVKAKTPYVAYHIIDPSKDGASPSTTSWLSSTKDDNIEMQLPDADSYITATSAGTDLDDPVGGQNSGTDTWVTFGFTESSFSNWTASALSTQAGGDDVIAVVFMTSTSQTANGDIGGVNDGTADLDSPWAALGVSDSVSFEGSTSSELDPPTVAINSVSSLNGSALVYGLWNGDIFDSPTLSVTVGSDTYTYPGSSEISLNGENWELSLTGYDAGSYPISVSFYDGLGHVDTDEATLLISGLGIDDLITMDTTPEITGASTDSAGGHTVTLNVYSAYDMTTPVISGATAVTAVGGGWTCTNLTALSVGTYTVEGSLTIDSAVSEAAAELKIITSVVYPEIAIDASSLTVSGGAATITGTSNHQDCPSPVMDMTIDGPNTPAAGDLTIHGDGTWSISYSNLVSGTYAITAALSAGDYDAEDVKELFISSSPIVGAVTLERYSGKSLKFLLNRLLENSSDPDGSALTVSAVAASSDNGAAVSASGVWGYYTQPGNDLTDYFTFTVENAFGNSASGTAEVLVVAEELPEGVTLNYIGTNTGESGILLKFVGIPGRSYTLQYCTDLQVLDWQTLSTQLAGDTGLFEYTDAYEGDTRFYRLVPSVLLD